MNGTNFMEREINVGWALKKAPEKKRRR